MAETSWSKAHVRTNGVRLHVVTAGSPDGPPVILLHGFPEFWWAWRGQIDALAGAGMRVIVPDLRGYGQSEAPPRVASYRLPLLVGDVIGLADARGAGRFTLVGHDWGGVVAWAVAALHPARVARLVIINAPHLAVFAPVVRRHPSQLLRSAYVGFFQLPFVAEAALRARDFALMRQALIASSRPGTFSAAEIDRYAGEWARAGRLRGMLNYYRALVRHRAPALERVEPPTEILWGRRDTALRPELAEASLGRCGDGRLRMVETATHWLHLEEPGLVTAAILGRTPP